MWLQGNYRLFITAVDIAYFGYYFVILPTYLYGESVDKIKTIDVYK